MLSLMVFFAAAQDTTKINGSTNSTIYVCAGSNIVLTGSINVPFLTTDSLIWKQCIDDVLPYVTILRTIYTTSTVTVPCNSTFPFSATPAVFGHSYSYILIVKRIGNTVPPPAGFTASITINVNPLPTASVTPGGPLTVCYGTSVTLTANTGVGYTYQWQTSSDGGLLVPWADIPSATTSTYTYVAGNTSAYRIKITNSNGCINYSN